MLGQFKFLLLLLSAYGEDAVAPGSADGWNWSVGMPQQSGYGFCLGGEYAGWSDASSGLQKKCAQWCDAAGTDAAGKPKCVGFSARGGFSRLYGFYYYCYNCPSLTKANIDCKCGQCNKKKIDDQPYRIYARKSTQGFNWQYDFQKDGCASDLNPCEPGLSTATAISGLAEDWNWKIGMPQQSGYGFCHGGHYAGWSDASSGLQKKCVQWCDAAGTDAAGKPKCVGFSAREVFSHLYGFYYYCYNCPSLTMANIDCKCGQCSKRKTNDQPWPYRIYARKSTNGFNWYYDFQKDGCASDLNPCEPGLSTAASGLTVVKNNSMIDSQSNFEPLVEVNLEVAVNV